MRRFATASRTRFGTRRWASTKADVSDEKLLQDIHGHLGDAGRVNIESKTISTALGELPLAPVMNPAWIRARRRTSKDRQGQVSGRFQGKLRLNPYAIALASPIRNCAATGVHLPRFFLQDMEIVKHPEKDELWYAPGSQAIDQVQPVYTSEDPAKDDISEPDSELLDHNENEVGSASQAAGKEMHQGGSGRMRFYILGRKEVFDPVDEKSAIKGALLGGRSGTLAVSELRNANWKKGTGDLFLDVLRRTATDALITRANRTREGQESRFLQPVSDWEHVAGVESRESVLWLPEEAALAGDSAAVGPDYATFDIDAAKYNRKMAVFNLSSLLGGTEVARLRKSMPKVFGQHRLVVLKRFPSYSMISLHLLLWRLQGYLRRTPE